MCMTHDLVGCSVYRRCEAKSSVMSITAGKSHSLLGMRTISSAHVGFQYEHLLMRDQALTPPISQEGGGCTACIMVQKVSLLVAVLV